MFVKPIRLGRCTSETLFFMAEMEGTLASNRIVNDVLCIKFRPYLRLSGGNRAKRRRRKPKRRV